MVFLFLFKSINLWVFGSRTHNHSVSPSPFALTYSLSLSLPSPGAQCQLRGGCIRAGVPVQGARRDGTSDGARATRPHAAVRRQGEHRALYGTLPLNHAHSFCFVCRACPPLPPTPSPSPLLNLSTLSEGLTHLAAIWDLVVSCLCVFFVCGFFSWG